MSDLLVSTEGGICTLTLNRPERKNALNNNIWDGLDAAIRKAQADSKVHVLVITGAGGAFCSGQDLSEPAGGRGNPLDGMRKVGDLAVALHRFPKPTIAKVDGVAAGAGCSLALACDLVVASDRSRFIQIFATRGLNVDFGGAWLLTRRVGLTMAKELALLAQPITGEEAEHIGLVNRSMEHSDLDKFVHDWAKRLAEGPSQALSLGKRLIDIGAEVSFDQALEFETLSQSINFNGPETKEAMAAFKEKRDPRFH